MDLILKSPLFLRECKGKRRRAHPLDFFLDPVGERRLKCDRLSGAKDSFGLKIVLCIMV